MHAGFTLALVLALSSCGESEQGATTDLRDFNSSKQTIRERSPGGWGEKLMSIIPPRGNEALPALNEVQAALAPCEITTGQSNRRCDLSAVPVTRGDQPTIEVSVDDSDIGVRAISLTACCSTEDDFFQPFARLPVLRTDVLCPELTIAASEAVKTYRVSAPGIRDFVYWNATTPTPRGRSTTVKVYLVPIEQGSECVAFTSADENEGESTQIRAAGHLSGRAETVSN